MKIDTHKLNLSKKHLLAIAVIVAIGILLGKAILGQGVGNTSEDGSHHPTKHIESAAHSDTEHHGEARGDQHDHDAGIIELSDAQIAAASIRVDTAGAARLRSVLHLPGEIRLNEDRTSHVVPRIAGVVESVEAGLGQAVKKGQVLAVIASVAASEQRSEFQTAQKRLVLAKTTFEREKRLVVV